MNFRGRRFKLLNSMVELVSRVEKLGPDTGLGTQGGYRFSAVSYKTQMKKIKETLNLTISERFNPPL